MKENNIVAGLDIGSSKTRLAVAQIEEIEDGNSKVNIIGLSEVDTDGVTKGNVSNVEDLVSTISSVLEKSEMMVGLSIDSVSVGIAGSHIKSKMDKGVVAIPKTNSEISVDDVSRVIGNVRSVAVSTNYDNIHVIPTTYNVDSQTGVKDPIGMTGGTLEAEVHVINGLSTRIQNFVKAIHRTKLEVEPLVFSVLATAEAVLNKKQKELGVLVLDIGHTITKGAIFEDGEVIYSFNIPIGSSHITSDLAIGLRSSIDVAERVKRKEATLDVSSIRRSEKVKLTNYTKDKEHVTASRKQNLVDKRYLNQIIEARVDEIFSYVAKELKTAKRFGKLPAGVVLTGGGAKLPDLVEYVKDRLQLPASLGHPTGFITTTEKVNDLSYATVCGLVMMSAAEVDSSSGGGAISRVLSKIKWIPENNLKFSGIGDKLKKAIKALMP